MSHRYRVYVLEESPSAEQECKACAIEWKVETSCIPLSDAIETLSEGLPDLLVFPYNTGRSPLLKEIRKRFPSLKVLAIGERATPKEAVHAIQLGCLDFIAKPLTSPELSKAVVTLLDEERTRPLSVNDPWFVGQSQALADMFNAIRQYGRHDTIMLCGRGGSGKQHVAEIIHHTFRRTNTPLVSINLSEYAEESKETIFWSTIRELFSRQERSGDSTSNIDTPAIETLYLQGIESCTPDFWASLMAMLNPEGRERLLSSGVKIIIGVDQPEDNAILANMLPGVVTIDVPALSQRKEDISDMLVAFIEKYNRQYGMHVESLDADVFRILTHYGWPGSVREFDSLIESLFLTTKTPHRLTLAALSYTLPMIVDTIQPAKHAPGISLQELKRLAHAEIASTVYKSRGEKAPHDMETLFDLYGLPQ